MNQTRHFWKECSCSYPFLTFGENTTILTTNFNCVISIPMICMGWRLSLERTVSMNCETVLVAAAGTLKSFSLDRDGHFLP